MTPFNYCNLHVNRLIVDNGIFNTAMNPIYEQASQAFGTVVSVTINSANNTPNFIGMPTQYGSFLVKVQGPGTSTTYASAVFMISKSNPANSAGSIMRTTSSLGALGEEVNIQWGANSFPQLYHSTTSSSGFNVAYQVTYL